MSNEVIDLCGSPEMPRRPTGVARFPTSPVSRTVIDILDDEAAAATASEASRGLKTDPNERLETTGSSSRKRKRSWIRDTSETAAAVAADDVVLVETVVPARPELQVMEVFPDAAVPPIIALLKQYENSNKHCAAQLVIAHMAEHGYEKSARKKSATPLHRRSTGDPVVHMQGASTWKYDYMSTESFSPTANYVIQATDLLLCDFPFLPKKAAHVMMRKCSNHYAVAHDRILTTLKGTKTGEEAEDEQFQLVMSAFSGEPLRNQEFESVKALTGKGGSTPLKRPRKKKVKPLVTDTVLLEEQKYVKGKLKEWMDTIRTRQERRRAKELAQQNGTAVECTCCYDSYPMDDMVACKAGHIFCRDCLKSVVENLVFGQGNLGVEKSTKQPALELQCFHGDGCSSGFQRGCLERLPMKLLQKYDQVQSQLSIERAGLSDVCSCPKCGYQADVPPELKIFTCPIAECCYESCRECGEAAHIPLRCNEVEKEKETEGRLTVEEAITAALIRKCPACSKPFIKSDGCNKIRCGCGAFVCWVCNKRIKDYKHFCQTPHCRHKNCHKCPLYTKDEEDNARAMRDAGYKAAEEVRKQNLASGHDNGKKEELRVDVEGILKAK